MGFPNKQDAEQSRIENLGVLGLIGCPNKQTT